MANLKYDREITAPSNGDAMVSWRLTRAAQLLGIEYPIIQAPFGGFPSQRLTATVSNLGGLGSLGAVTLGSSAINEVIGEIRSLYTEALRDQSLGFNIRSGSLAYQC